MTVDILFLSDSETVGLRAASIFAARSKIAVAERGRFSVALSGGTTPLKLFWQLGAAYGRDTKEFISKAPSPSPTPPPKVGALSRGEGYNISPPLRGGDEGEGDVCGFTNDRISIRWDRTDIFWVDERCVPPYHEDSNYKAVDGSLLSRLDIPQENIHRISGEMPPEEGAREYEKELRRCFGEQGLPAFDLVILGVGEDGHTASLFHEALSLAESGRLAIPVYVEKLKSWRITLTFPVLNNASDIVFLVTGLKKSHIVKELLGSGGNSLKYPAGLIQPVHGNVTWLIDEEASFLLQRT